jgi:phage tail-like protein
MKHAEIERLLPVVIQRAQPAGSPLAAVIDAMEALQEPAEEVLTQLVAFFDPRRCPPHFLTMLAHWVNLDHLYPRREAEVGGLDWTARPAPMAEGRLRELIASAPELAQLRGTAQGLKKFLEITVGMSFAIEETVADAAGAVIPFHVRIVAPTDAQAQRELINRIVELEKPAHVTYELVFRDSADH